MGSTVKWIPPTPTPEAGQGPWCDLDLTTWWVVADSPEAAIAVVRSTDADVMPDYFGWEATIRPVQICWVDPEDWNEENEIRVAGVDDSDRVNAWQLEFGDA